MENVFTLFTVSHSLTIGNTEFYTFLYKTIFFKQAYFYNTAKSSRSRELVKCVFIIIGKKNDENKKSKLYHWYQGSGHYLQQGVGGIPKTDHTHNVPQSNILRKSCALKFCPPPTASTLILCPHRFHRPRRK